MTLRYWIEDDLHAELIAEHDTLASAIAELERLALVPWDEAPNLAPCQSWRTCGRKYEIVEYETSTAPWQKLRRLAALEVDAKGPVWARGFSGPDGRKDGGRDQDKAPFP